METTLLTVQTGDRERVHELTRECGEFVRDKGDARQVRLSFLAG